jgi:hypothetical protein
MDARGIAVRLSSIGVLVLMAVAVRAAVTRPGKRRVRKSLQQKPRRVALVADLPFASPSHAGDAKLYVIGGRQVVACSSMPMAARARM